MNEDLDLRVGYYGGLSSSHVSHVFSNNIGSIITYKGKIPPMSSWQEKAAQSQRDKIKKERLGEFLQKGNIVGSQMSVGSQANSAQQSIQMQQHSSQIQNQMNCIAGGLSQYGAAAGNSSIDNMFFELDRNKQPERLKEKPKGVSMFGEFKKDVKGFMGEHKGLIYSIIGLYLLDHFLLEGKLKAKLLDLANRMVGKVEGKIDAIGTKPEAK